MKCAVANCDNSNEGKASTCSFFGFPSDPNLQKIWVQFCGRTEKFNPKTSFICMDHFRTEDFSNNLKFEMGFAKRRILNQGAVPSIKTISSENLDIFDEYPSRKERHENRRIIHDFLQEDDSKTDQMDDDTIEISIQLQDNEDPLSGNDEEELVYYEDEECVESLKIELETLRQENEILKNDQKQHDAELNAIKSEMSKMVDFHEYTMDKLNKDLTKTNYKLVKLEEKLLRMVTKHQNSK